MNYEKFIIHSRRSELVKVGTKIAKASLSGDNPTFVAIKAGVSTLEVASYAIEASDSINYFCHKLEAKLAQMDASQPSRSIASAAIRS